MCTSGKNSPRLGRSALTTVLGLSLLLAPLSAQTKPTGAPLVLSSVETEQEVPLAILLPDGKTAECVPIRVHWLSQPSVGPDEDAASFTIDLPADSPAAPIFTAQLWNASLASAMAWQQPWEGARWKILQTPSADGTGIDAALAVGMIATSARRPYPPKTVVVGSLNPDGSLGPVSHLLARIDAAAAAGMTRVIIPSVQRFDTDADGNVVNIVRHATELHLDCVPVDDLVSATETTMNDPLPEVTVDSSVPKYSNDVASYIDDFAHHEEVEADAGLKYAPTQDQLATYPPRLAAIWKSVYADYDAGQQAYRAGQVYVAYYLFCRANGRMNGANALAGQTRAGFDVKAALDESDDLHNQIEALMNPPSIDKGELQSAVLVAQMADWAYDIKAALEGAQLVAKQAFSQRSDATLAQKDRAREAILFANEECKYLLTQANFYTGLAGHIGEDNPLPVDENAAHLLPQLIPAQLATARHFTEGILASDLRDGLLFDPRLVAYVNVLRQVKADWDAHQRKQLIDAQVQTAAAQPAASANASTNAAPQTPVKLNSNNAGGAAFFDPGNTYLPPHTVVATAPSAKRLSDVALCLIWVNHDCEIATLDQKYLRLAGSMDPATHDWRVKDRPRLDNLIRLADFGARQGIAFAEKAEIDPSVLAMIYERASQERIEGDDVAALDALRNYWRCALLGNMCWQLAHTSKAQPVDVAATPAKPAQGNQGKTNATAQAAAPKKPAAPAPAPAASTNVVVQVNAPGGQTTTNLVVTPAPPPPTPAPVPAPAAGPVVMPAPAPTTPVASNPAPNPGPASSTPDDANIPVAPIAHDQDMAETPVAPAPAPAPVPADNGPVVIPVAPIAKVDTAANPPLAPVAPDGDSEPAAPRAQPVENTAAETPAPPPSAPAPMPSPAPSPATASTDNIPVAPIARVEDYSGNPPATNAAPIGPVSPTKSDNADGHAMP